MEPQVVRGPVAPNDWGAILYHVTLASGAVATSPASFGGEEVGPAYLSPLVTEDGRVLMVPAGPREPQPHPPLA